MTSKKPDLLAELPVLDLASATETGAGVNLDWPLGGHSSQAKPIQSQTDGTKVWEVSQSLEAVGGIQKLLDSRQATFAVEARCLHTAWCESFIGKPGSNNLTVEILEDMTRGVIFLCPGVITLEDCELETEDLHPIQRPVDGSNILIPAGYWLVLGRSIPVHASEKEAMVFFAVDENLPDGEMRITAENVSDDVHFKVSLSKLYHQLVQGDRVLQWGCHLAALAMLPYIEGYEIEEKEDGTPSVPGSIIGQHLADRLHAADIPLWAPKEDWDPARALTASGMLEVPMAPNSSHENEHDRAE